MYLLEMAGNDVMNDFMYVKIGNQVKSEYPALNPNHKRRWIQADVYA